MKITTTYPHQIREVENFWIPLSDGTRLAGRMWLPVDAETKPVPALLEYLPYRKSDGTAVRDSIRHPYLAGHGYASIRIDMRGSGDSDGILYDEYLPQEQDDALEVLSWIAGQKWCDGSIGMFGKSWGGFNGLQIAARRPPELKAIITICSTDDRYADDVHYMGGCLLASEMLPWASTMLAYTASPPDPRWVGDRWRSMWLERMDKTPPFVEAWMAHQRRDDFWRHGSVCEDYAAIQIPVYAVGGWADGYTNAILRLLAGLACPKKGLIGPWAHDFPEDGRPGPATGFLQESLRWWDHWLKGIDTGIMDEPVLRTWIQESVPPRTHYAVRDGRWVVDPAWPSPHIQTRVYALTEAKSLEIGEGDATIPPFQAPLAFRGQQMTGIDSQRWLFTDAGDFATDQRAEDGRSLTFTTAPVNERVEILGFPELDVSISVDQPIALLAVRLCDVAPTGASTLVSWGLLNLTHRGSHAEPVPLEPHKRYEVRVQLNAAGHALPEGHRWRIALSPTYWPHAWPSPHPVTLTLYGGRLRLPVRPPQPADAELPRFDLPECAPQLGLECLQTPSKQRKRRHDLVTGKTELEVIVDDGRIRFVDNGLETAGTTVDRYTIVAGNPLSAAVTCERTGAWKREHWDVRVETVSKMTADADQFYITNALDAYEGDVRVFNKTWTLTIPRDHT